LFWKAWDSYFKQATILKAFETTGISPLNPDAILRRFTSTDPAEQSSRASSTSVLSASDWRKIERIVKGAAKAIASKRTCTLSYTIHSISVQNQLLKHEVEGLRRALANKKRRKKCGKPLPSEQPEEYHGGAIIWSSKKVKEARDRLEQKEREEEKLQLQKAEAAELRRAQQEYKARLLQERRVSRAEAKLAKEKEKAEQAAKQAAKQAQKQKAQRAQSYFKIVSN
jgi:hypothetical protein